MNEMEYSSISIPLMSLPHATERSGVSNIEALYQEYLAANVVTSSQVRTKPWGFKEFHICDPFRNIFIFAESLPEGEC